MPPVKIVENSEIRRDIEEVYLRASRKPEAVALDLWAQFAGNITARDRVLRLIERYGADVVKGVMKRILSNSEKAFLDKLKRLPDGVWRDRTYVECCRPGDRRTHTVMLTLRKEGQRLIFENGGSAPQDGAMNATFSGWRGAIMVALNQLLCWDQYFAIGGALRHVEFDPTPGTFNCATFPASVSTAPVQAMEISLYPAYNVLSKMLFPDPRMRDDIMCIGGTSQWPASIFRGIDQWGERYGYLLVDPIGGAIGAFSTGDGISNGGQARTPICRLPNVEHNEQSFPMLTLYRKEVVDLGGAGRWRGGLSAETCFVPHRTEEIIHDTLSSGNAMPTSTGMMGGYPATVNIYKFRRDTDIRKRMDKGELIDDIQQVSGQDEELGLRQQDFVQRPADVYAVIWTAAGGFGDPLERHPQRVWQDVFENGAVSRTAADEIYGVVFTSDDQLDEAATEQLRARRRDARRRKDGKVTRAKGRVVAQLSDNLSLRQARGTVRICCVKCAADLGPLGSNYKTSCEQIDREITAANPNIGDWQRYIDERPVFRQFCCPGCGALIENEVARESDPVLWDTQIEARAEWLVKAEKRAVGAG